MTIVEFINARLDEDELIAQDAAEVHLGWPREKRGHWTAEIDGISPHLGYLKDRQVLEHVALHDPARVLREVGAKRTILSTSERFQDDGNVGPIAAVLLKVLASVYDDHPDFDPAWRP